MEEVIVSEAPPVLVPAVALELPFPKYAQALLQVLNRLHPFQEERDDDNASSADAEGTAGTTSRPSVETLPNDRVCPTSREAPLRDGNGSAVTTCRAAAHLKRIRKSSKPGVLEVLVELSPSHEWAVPQHEHGDPEDGAHDDNGAEERKRPKVEQDRDESDLSLRLRAAYADVLDAVRERLAKDPTADALAHSVTFHTVHVPDRAPRQRPETWLEWNAVWPFAVPKPHALEAPAPFLVQQANAVMTTAVLPLARNVMQRHPHLLGIAALVVDPNDVDPGTQLPRVVATSEGCLSMDRRNPSACSPYVAPEVLAASSDKANTRLVLEHPVMHALKKLAATQRSAATDASGSEASSVLTGSDPTHSSAGRVNAQHHDHGCLEEAERRRQEGIAAGKPYLANELDLYVSHEPCVMCAMALVHSRIARVFFCFPNCVHGGLGSVYAVHAIRSLNHHYRAYHCKDAAQNYDGPPLLE